MIPLQIKRSGAEVVGPKGAVGAADERLVVDHLLAVEYDGDVTINQRDVVALPLAASLAGVFARLNAPNIAPTP